MNYYLVVDWLKASNLIDGFVVRSGTVEAPISAKEKRICVSPMGGTLISDVNNEVLVNVSFFSNQSGYTKDFNDSIIAILNHSRENYSFNGYTIQCISNLTKPVPLDGGRVMVECGFRIL